MAKRTEVRGGVTRRGFLKGAIAGLVSGLAVLAIFGGRRLITRKRRVVSEFPEDSIFAPARNHRDRA